MQILEALQKQNREYEAECQLLRRQAITTPAHAPLPVSPKLGKKSPVIARHVQKDKENSNVVEFDNKVPNEKASECNQQ